MLMSHPRDDSMRQWSTVVTEADHSFMRESHRFVIRLGVCPYLFIF